MLLFPQRHPVLLFSQVTRHFFQRETGNRPGKDRSQVIYLQLLHIYQGIPLLYLHPCLHNNQSMQYIPAEKPGQQLLQR